MVEDKVMVCAGFKADNEKDCVAGGGRWMDENDVLLVGKGASRGKLIATVRVVNGDEEKKMQLTEGEIMVADRTTPSDILYMKKVAAFITDRGGVGSHTGIVARELELPAVVGTVDGTKVLKDGQKVFLDGEKGIVLNVTPEIEAEMEEIPKLAPGATPVTDKLEAMAIKKGITVPPSFWEEKRRRERGG